jgi:adenylate kinase
MARLVLVGAPASGKGTQAQKLCVALGVPAISTGDMLRAARASGTELGQKADAFMRSGQLVPDDLVVGLVVERLSQPDAAGGFILDGFPRTVAQADSLGTILRPSGKSIEHVLLIDVPRELLLERATLRRIDKQTGQIYHLKYNPPPAGAEVIQRADDQPETVAHRLDEYEAMTAALIPYYTAQGLLRQVDGVGTPEQVAARLLRSIES